MEKVQIITTQDVVDLALSLEMVKKEFVDLDRKRETLVKKTDYLRSIFWDKVRAELSSNDYKKLQFELSDDLKSVSIMISDELTADEKLIETTIDVKLNPKFDADILRLLREKGLIS